MTGEGGKPVELGRGAIGVTYKAFEVDLLCPVMLKAGREGKTRERLLERARAELDKIAGSKRRVSAKTLGARVGRVLERSKMSKFVRWDVLDGRLSWSFDQDEIAAEKLFDGCYIVSGEVPKEKMAASEVVASYKKLGLAEEAFRNLKTMQLEVRPVYHKTDDRIRSHVFLCTLAYYLQWHLKQRLEPLFPQTAPTKIANGQCAT